MVKLNSFFNSSDLFPKLDVDQCFSCIEYRTYQESKMNRVWSEQHYIIFVLEGKKTIHTSTESWNVNPQQALFLRKGGYLLSEIPAHDSFQSLLFFLDDRFLEKFIAQERDLFSDFRQTQPSPVPAAIPIPVTDALTLFYQSVLPFFDLQPSLVQKRLLEHKMYELLLQLLSANQHTNFASILLETAQKQTYGIRNIMEQNFFMNMSLEEFAKLSNCSLSTFKREFQKIYHTSPGRWLLQKRLEYARLLLQTSNKNISEIAHQSGFDNNSHFSQAFKKRFLNTPQNYRQQFLTV